MKVRAKIIISSKQSKRGSSAQCSCKGPGGNECAARASEREKPANCVSSSEQRFGRMQRDIGTGLASPTRGWLQRGPQEMYKVLRERGSFHRICLLAASPLSQRSPTRGGRNKEGTGGAPVQLVGPKAGLHCCCCCRWTIVRLASLSLSNVSNCLLCVYS